MGVVDVFGKISGGVLSALTIIPNVISLVERIAGFFKDGGKPLYSEEKAVLAESLIRDALETVEGFSSKDIVDEVRFSAGIRMMINGVVECLNSSIWRKK